MRRARALGPVLAPALLLLAVYLAADPPSPDLAAALLRARVASAEGLAVWNNWWYAGHPLLGYSVLFPLLAGTSSPQLVGAAAAALTSILLAALALGHDPERRGAACWLAAAPMVNLFSGRLTFALGLLPAVGCVAALIRRRAALAAGLGALAALCSPVAALFSALAAAAMLPTAGRAGAAGLGGSLGALAVTGLLWGEGGTEPFAFSVLWPILLLAPAAWWAGAPPALLRGALLLAAGCLLAFALPTPVGANAARIGPLLAGPLLLLGARRRGVLLLAFGGALLYLQWQAPVRDVLATAGDPATTAAYYRPLVAFLERQAGPPFRLEVPFTRGHWEAYRLAPSYPLARGWERQLDRRWNGLFYGPRLPVARYEDWLHALAVRYVALPDAALDPSSAGEARLVRSRPPFLREVFSSRHWRVFAVLAATPIVSPPGRLISLGPEDVVIDAPRPGRLLVRVRWSPLWFLAAGDGCLSEAPPTSAGRFTEVAVARAGRLRMAIAVPLTAVPRHRGGC